MGDLAPRTSHEVCAEFLAPEPGSLNFTATARGACAPEVGADCQTRIAGIPAILLEVVNLDDPIEVGKLETYEIIVTNQGSAPGTNIQLICQLEAAQQFISGTGATEVRGEGGTVTVTPLGRLDPHARATWRVTVKALEAGDIRF